MHLSNCEEWQKAQRGELYRAFVPELIADRDRCRAATTAFNTTTDFSRRNLVKLWRDITMDERPLPPPAATQEEDDALFDSEPWVTPPIHADYGHPIKMGEGSFLNYNSSFVDTCPIYFGKRVVVGPNCSFYSGTHPLDPALRNGLSGPETGKPIHIEDDCWLGGNVIVLAGVRIGKGSTIGAGSVVTRDIPPFHVAAGNPARVLRRIETAMDPEQATTKVPANPEVAKGPEPVMSQDAQ